MIKTNRKKKLGYYEKRLCVLLFLSSIPNAFPVIQTLVTQFTPPHYCDLTDLIKATEEKWGKHDINAELRERLQDLFIPMQQDASGELSRSKCHRYNFSITPNVLESNFSDLSFNESNILPCTSWIYEGVEVSAVTEFNMVCHRSWLKPFSISFIFYGMMIGSIIAGYVTDRFGRKPCFLLFTFWQFIFGMMLSFTSNATFYAVMLGLCGIGHLLNYKIATVIGSEMLPIHVRPFSYFLLAMGYSVGYALSSPISYFLRNWRWFLRAVNIIGILYIPYIWLLDESPAWLVASGKLKEAKRIMQKISKINGNIEDNPETLIEKIEDGETPVGTWIICVEFMKHFWLVIRTLVICLAWFSMGFGYYVLSLGNNDLVGNRFLNLFLSSLTDIFSSVLYFFAVKKCGRRDSYMLSGTLMALCIAVLGLVQNVNGKASLAVTLAGKFMASLGWAVISLYTSELFPTNVRQTIVFLGSASARVGGLVSQYVLHAGESKFMMFSFLEVSALVLVSCIFCLILPETMHSPLPQTVEEALAMKRKPISCPWLRLKKKNKANGTQHISSGII